MLNPQQKRVVTHPSGPLLVLACPGSGKTRCIIERIITLLEEGVRPTNILAVTFTNKASKEMLERIQKQGFHQKILITTFHSLGVRILRKCGKLLGYKPNFSICDSHSQKQLLIKIVKGMDLDPKKSKWDYRRLIKMIEDKKNQVLSDDEFELHLEEDYVKIFREYHKTLKMSNSMDFGDLIYNTVKIFNENPRVRDAYAIKFKHILVDEMQDTNKAQLDMVRHLASKHNNVIAVGDQDQCFPEDTLVQTPDGTKPIQDFEIGDKIATVIKPGEIGESIVTRVVNKFYQRKLLKITLEDGSVVRCTPNHLIPMDVKIDDPYFIYLMYKKELGFRIGMCNSTRQGSFRGRLLQEHGDAIWVIDQADSKSDASIKEQYYAAKYGIPTLVFHNIGRKIITSKEQIEWLFKSVNTYDAGRKLLEEKGLDAEIPHHMPRMGSSRRGKITLNISLCADRGMHRYSMCTNDKTLLEQFGTPRKSKFKNWRIESSTKSINRINEIVNQAKQLYCGKLSIWMSIKADNDKPLRCQPASNLCPGSIVYLGGLQVGRIKVIKIEHESYSGDVYDLDVDKTHNYIASGVVVHNSVYGWRGACIANIEKFETYFPNAEVTHLSTNYRSTAEILSNAEKLINENSNRRMIPLVAHKGPSGQAVVYSEYDQPEDEAEGIAELAMARKWDGYDYKEMAILCRTNALTRSFEECFRRKQIPYVLIGTFGFYDRKEVKNSIAFMKFLANPEDAISFEEIINVPSRGVGPSSLLKILDYALENQLSFIEACRYGHQVKGLRKKTADCLNYFVDVLEKFDEDDLYESIVTIFEESGFLDHLRTTDRQKNEHREDNVLEFLRGFHGYCNRSGKPSLAKYLQEVMLISNSDRDSEEDAVKIMTCHASKGLEFDVVFVPGLEESTFPHKRSVAENNVQEERRVCYVAITRPRYHLYLSKAGVRVDGSTPIGTIPSRFLIEMGLVDKESWEKQ